MSSRLYRETGVVLRTYKLAEADRIVVLATEGSGKVRAVAKGVRRTTSRFGARLEPLSHVRLLLHRGRDLDVVNQADLVESWPTIHADLDRLTQGMALLEAADQLGLEREPNAELYRMLVGALRTLSLNRSALLVPAFYWKLLNAEGVRPELDVCVRCGEEEAPIVAFDVHEGGVLCRSCRSGVPVSAEALDLLRRVLGGGLVEALAVPASPATAEVGQLATRALEHHIERRLRAISMFEAH